MQDRLVDLGSYPIAPEFAFTLGFAPVYQYHVDTRTWLININATALNDDEGSDRAWAAAMFHEILHNIGWEHPDGYDDRQQYILAAQDAFRDCGKD